VLRQNDLLMISIMDAFEITEDQIIRLMLLRERNDRAPMEKTLEVCRLEFWKQEYEQGHRMSEGGGKWTAPKIAEVIAAIDFAGGAQDRRPEYTG